MGTHLSLVVPDNLLLRAGVGAPHRHRHLGVRVEHLGDKINRPVLDYLSCLVVAVSADSHVAVRNTQHFFYIHILGK